MPFNRFMFVSSSLTSHLRILSAKKILDTTCSQSRFSHLALGNHWQLFLSESASKSIGVMSEINVYCKYVNTILLGTLLLKSTWHICLYVIISKKIHEADLCTCNLLCLLSKCNRNSQHLSTFFYLLWVVEPQKFCSEVNIEC